MTLTSIFKEEEYLFLSLLVDGVLAAPQAALETCGFPTVAKATCLPPRENKVFSRPLSPANGERG